MVITNILGQTVANTCLLYTSLNSLQYDRDYTWNDNGELIRISSPRQTQSYSYSTTGRLTGVHTTAANLDIRIPYATDPAGNRLPDPEQMCIRDSPRTDETCRELRALLTLLPSAC